MKEYSIEEELVKETLFQRLADRLPAHSKFLLREQYRMIAPIGDLISTCFYDGELHSPRNDALRGYESFGCPVLWIDTSSLGDKRREQAPAGSTTSFRNRTEASIVKERLFTLDRALAKGFISPPVSDKKLEVLVIAPYRAQVDELRLRLAECSFANLDYSVQSVDAVQGREADLAIFSVTRSNSSGRLGFLGPEYWRRINVALSRAKFGLTIVGDTAFCRAAPGALRTVHEYMTNHPRTCEIRVVDDVS
jgi:superfamily I DNA and/or RNA helicase